MAEGGGQVAGDHPVARDAYHAGRGVEGGREGDVGVGVRVAGVGGAPGEVGLGGGGLGAEA